MHEKLESKIPSGLRSTARPRSKKAVPLSRIFARSLNFLAWMGGAFLLGQADLGFGAFPLGLSLLFSGLGDSLAVLAGLLICAGTQMKEPVLYLCVYSTAFVIRAVLWLLIDSDPSGGGLPARIREVLFPPESAKPEESGEASVTDAEKDGKENAEGNTGISPEQREDLVLEEASAALSKPRPGLRSRIRLALRRFADSPLTVGFWRILKAFSTLFSGSILLRMAASSLFSLALVLPRLIEGNFRFYDLFAALTAVFLAPLGVLLFSASANERVSETFWKLFSLGLLFGSLVFAAREVRVSGFPLSVILAFLFTLRAVSTVPTGYGLSASLLFGAASNPVTAPGYLFAALLLPPMTAAGKRDAGVVLGGLACAGWISYTGGFSLLWDALPALLIGGVAEVLCFRFASRKEAAPVPVPAMDPLSLRREIASVRQKDSTDAFRGISDAFSGLSEMFYNLSDRFRRPGTLDLRRLCDTALDRVCPDCPNRSVCWGLEYENTLDAVNSLIGELHKKGRVSGDALPESLARRCEALPSILEDINRDCAHLTGEMLRNNRTEIFAMDYEAASAIINDALEEEDGEYRFDPELALKVREYLSDAGVSAQSVTVFGSRRRQILVKGADITDAKVTVETMRSDLGEMCGIALTGPIFEIEGNSSEMVFRAVKKIGVLGAESNISADAGVSGDCVNLFSNRKDFFYALINDGMGSGRDAALTSNLCSVFLEKMLRAGNRASTSLSMLNNLIRSRGIDSSAEVSSTVDLLELDLMTGDASFVKSGAAPSFVLRDGQVHRLQAGTFPIGIIKTLDAQVSRFSLRVGDTVVLISDGVLQDDPEGAWLISYLLSSSALSPEEIAFGICSRAASFERHDDCSALVLRVVEAEEETRG